MCVNLKFACIIPTSLNPPSEDDMEKDEGHESEDDDEDDDTLNVDLNVKGYSERGIVLSEERCHGLREYFKETSIRDGGHIIENGCRKMLAIDPHRNPDMRMKQVIEDVKRHMIQCFPKKYPNVDSVTIKEIQLIANQKGFDIDQHRHCDSFYDNLVLTVLLQTGRADNQKGTLTLMSPIEYTNIYRLSEALKREHNITQEEWDDMLVATFESIRNGLSQEGKRKDTMFSVTEQEREIWMSLLHGNGLSSKDGIAFSEAEMGHARNRDQDGIGEGVLFRSNRSHLGVGNQKDGESVMEEDLDERLVIYFAFGSEEPANFLQNTSLVIYVEALLDKLTLGPIPSRIEKRSVTSAYECAQAAVATCYKYGDSITSSKTISPIRGDGNCLFGSVRSALLWLVCHIRNTIDPAQYEICPVYKMIVEVVKSEETGSSLLRGYACDALCNELLDTNMPGNRRIEMSDDSIDLSPRDKLIASLEAMSENIVKDVKITETVVQDVRIVTQNSLSDYIKKMRVDKEYGDVTMLLTLQLMLCHYAVIVKCEVANGLLSEEAMAPMGIEDPRFVIRLYYYAKPTIRCNECHYDHIMDCNPNATGLLHLSHSKKMYTYILIWSRCFWNSNRFVIKNAPGSGKGLFANDVFDKDHIVTIYPKGVSYGSLDLLPADCDMKHIYVFQSVFYCNALHAAKYTWDPGTATYVPLPEDAGIGLAMFINSSKGAVKLKCNCKFKTVEVWDPTTKTLMEYYCVVAKEKIQPGGEFIVKYFMDGAEKRARDAQLEDEETSHTENNSSVRAIGRPTAADDVRHLISIDSAATKHFDSCIANLPEKRKRESKKVEPGQDLKRQRKSTRLVKATTVSIKANLLGEQKTKKTRGPNKTKAPKKEKIPTQKKLVVEQIDTTPNGVTQTTESVKDVAKIKADVESDFPDVESDFAKQKADMESNFERQKTDMESNFERQKTEMEAKFAKEKTAIQADFETRLATELRIQKLEVNAAHACAIAEFQANLNGCEVYISTLQTQLDPYLRESRHSQMMSQFMARDAHPGVTDARVNAYYTNLQSFPVQTPFSQRGMSMSFSQQNNHPPQTQPALLPSPILPALLPSPILPALLPAEPQPAPTQPVLEVKAEKPNTN